MTSRRHRVHRSLTGVFVYENNKFFPIDGMVFVQGRSARVS